MATLTAVVLVAAPIVTWRSGEAAYRGAVADQQERKRLVAVPAVLLEDAPPAGQVYAEGAQPHLSAIARWTAPDGTSRSGPVIPPDPAPAGTTIIIWTDAAGNQRDRTPVTGPSSSAAGAAVTCLLVLLAGYASVLLGVRRYLNRRRMMSWQREWTYVEPRWSGRRRAPARRSVGVGGACPSSPPPTGRRGRYPLVIHCRPFPRRSGRAT